MVGVCCGILTGLGVQAIVVKWQTLTDKVEPFIEAARLSGGGHGHVITRHVLPALVPLSIVNGVLAVVGAMLTESLPSCFGRTACHLNWGTMIWLGQETLRWLPSQGPWHVILPPALAIILCCGAFYLVGRSLDGVLNPRLARRWAGQLPARNSGCDRQ